MSIMLIVFAVALLFAALLLRVARGHAAMVRGLPELEGRTRPVDIAAFRNLVDPAEEEYLKAQLPKGQFRRIQRQRVRATLEYVERTRHNAAILLRLGESASRDPNPEVAAAARELVNTALRLRVTALVATGILAARVAMPETHISIGRVADVYERLTERVRGLTGLQNPADVHRVSAAI
jgi:hypothetical protein